MKKGINKNIIENIITQSVFFENIYIDLLDDLLDKINQEYVKKLLGENDWPYDFYSIIFSLYAYVYCFS